MDWNWFYSSVAQSVAAIVGLLGAFIVAKTIAGQARFDQQGARNRDLQSRSRDLLLLAAALPFERYNTWALRRITAQVNRLRRAGDAATEAEHYRDLVNVAPFQDPEAVLTVIRKAMQDPPSPPGSMEAALSDLTATTSDWGDLRAKIDQGIEDLVAHCSEVHRHVSEIKTNPESSPLVSWAGYSLLVLFVVGILLPLACLPARQSTPWQELLSQLANPDALKLTILGTVSLVFIVLVLRLIRINHNLRHDRRTIRELEEFSLLQNYSPHLKAWLSKP